MTVHHGFNNCTLHLTLYTYIHIFVYYIYLIYYSTYIHILVYYTVYTHVLLCLGLGFQVSQGSVRLQTVAFKRRSLKTKDILMTKRLKHVQRWVSVVKTLNKGA